ncbi:MAG: accessory gene regulator B family protein [Lachnospiraceae bacterium]|nr:accessory gene regulator B family protein [Lachnospiraceae bacterium]
MDKILRILSKKIMDKLNVDVQEYAIVLYGIQQTLLIGLNILTVILLGFLWGEFLFSILFFVWFAILRPFSGGYHADTELRCYIMSVAMLNIILICKHYVNFFVWQYLIIWILAFLIIFRYAPVENSSNRLDKSEILVYGKKTRRILFVFSIFMLLSIIQGLEVIYSSIVFSLFLCSVLVLAGKIKYEKYIVKE